MKNISNLFKIVSLMVFASLFACDNVAESGRAETEEMKATFYIDYFKDPRTNLCFAGEVNGSWNSTTITNVPCTSEVEKLVKPFPSCYMGGCKR